MALVIVTTVGTSVLTNVLPPGELELAAAGRHLRSATNLRPGELSDEQQAALGLAEARARARLAAADAADLRKASAELAVLVPLGAEHPERRVQHWLVHSATEVGARAARILRDHLDVSGEAVQLFEVEELRTTSVEEFQLAAASIARWCAQTLPGYRASGHRVVFNVAGGFKTLSGYLQVLGMFHADETVYTFEGTGELLRVPRLPVRVDLDDREVDALRRVRVAMADLPRDAVDVPDALLLVLDGKVGGLSAYGEVVWDQAVDADGYRRRLVASPHPRLVYADTLSRSVRDLPADRLRELNRRVDQLCRYLDSDGQHNPRGLDLKRLQGDPVPGSTHEFDVWHDGATGRGFCHFEQRDNGKVLVIDRVGAALH